MTAAIEAIDLTKRYGEFTAVDCLNLRIDEGEIFGFLGPNGAGKTTTIMMFLGLTFPSSGIANVYGYDCARNPLEVKRVTGYLPETLGFYGELSARENLLYTASLNGIGRREALRRLDEALGYVGLADRATQPVKQYSRGMRQRLGIADVLIKRPKVVLLDEPIQGIDSATVEDVLNLITGMSRDQGITVLVSSHQLHYIQRICDRVGIMSQSQMVVQGTIGELAQQSHQGEGIVIEMGFERVSDDLQAALKAIPGVDSVSVRGNLVTVECQPEARTQIANVAIRHGDSLHTLQSGDSVLENIYLRYFQQV